MDEDDPLAASKYADFDISKPNVARVYDAMLGGKDNFTADREFLAETLQALPAAPLGAIANRQFLGRVVKYLVAEAGVTQFLDVGSGLPTQGNVSEVAHQCDPQVHVVHVDDDPVVYTHSKALLANAKTTEFVLGDVRAPGEILAHPDVRSMIDFDRPVGLLFFAILHHVQDDAHPERLMAEFRDAVPGGSYLAISSLRLPGPETPDLRAFTITAEKNSGPLGPMRWREEGEIRSWFGDWEMIPPGLVPLVDWRPEQDSVTASAGLRSSFFGGVAQKR